MKKAGLPSYEKSEHVFITGQEYTADEVLCYIRSIHDAGEDDDFSERVWVHQTYQAVELDVATLESSTYYLDEERIDEYIRLDTPIPPIVYHLYEDTKLLIDGGHRLEVAKKKKQSKILALVGSDEPDWTEYDTLYEE